MLMIARKSLVITASQFFARFLGLIGLILLAKLWGGFAADALGIIGFALSFLALFSFIADLGFNKTHVKRISEGKDLGTCLGTYATIKIALIGIMVAAVLVAIFVWKTLLHRQFYDATTESVVYVFVFYYIFLNLHQIATVTFEGTRETAKMETAKTFENLVKVPLMIFVALAGVLIIGKKTIAPAIHWPGILQPLQQFLALHAVGSLAMAYVFGVLAVFLVGLYLLRTYEWNKPTVLMAKSYLSFAFPLMFASIIGVISVNIDKIMIGYFWTAKEVGYYFAVQQVSQSIVIIPTAVCTVLFPTLSQFHAQQNFEKIKSIISSAERYISMILIPIVVVIFIFVQPVINILLNSAFMPATSVLLILALYALLMGLTMPYSALMGAINRPDMSMKIGVATCVVTIGLNFLFIPKDGLLSTFGITGPTGAATATIFASLITFVGLIIAAKKLAAIKMMQSHTPRHLLAGIIMGGSLYSLNIIFPVSRWYQLIGFSFIGISIYITVLFLLKEFKKEDLFFFLNILYPKETLRYIKSELKQK